MSYPVSTQPGELSVAHKTMRGAFSLGVRQVLVQGARIVAGIVLARILTPAEFGVYAIVLYLQTFLVAFGDAGLAGSLIRQHDEPETADYRAIFTIQQMLVLAIAGLMWIASPWIAARYHLDPHQAWLFRLVALSFLATSFMVIPQVQLERHIQFHKVALIDSVQAVVFNGFAVILAWKGFGAYAFAWALLLRALVGAVLANWISPWSIGWHWDWVLVKRHLAFGIPYQGIQATSLLKDSITPILIGLLMGTGEVGYITWAAMIAAYPVMALMVLQRVYMPAFARLQNRQVELAALVENVIWATNAIAAPLAIITLVLVVPITTLVYGQKWLVALPYFYLFWVANLFVPTATPTLSLLSAMGRSRTALLYAVVWMAGTWVLGAPLILLYGGIGFAVANAFVQISNLWLYRSAQRHIPFQVYRVILPVWILAVGSGCLLLGLCRLHAPTDILSLVLYGCTGLVLYGCGVLAYYQEKLQAKWKGIRRPA